MRITMGIIAALGLGAACGKSNDRGPEPATAQIMKNEAAAPVTPETPSDPDRDRIPPPADEAKGPANRTQAIEDSLAAMQRGDTRAALKYVADDITWTEVGLPDGELDSLDEIVQYEARSRTGFADVKITPSRVIESADYQVVEYVWSARHTGAFADGTAATDKVATVPGAMLIRYDDDGLIDRVWRFQDWPSALQQLGLAPGLPEGFRAVEAPTSAEVVMGPSTTDYRTTYVDFMNRLGTDLAGAYKDRTTDDFAWSDFSSGRRVTTRDVAGPYFATSQGRFVQDSMEIQTAISAGPYFVAYVEHKLVYKGGLLDVPAEDQRITTHTLDIVQFDPATTRLRTLASYGNSYEILAGLNITAGAASRPQAKDMRFGIDACDDYVTHMRACMGSLDGTARESARVALDAQIATWQRDTGVGQARENVKASCQALLDAAKSAYASTCPRVDWTD